MPSNRNYIRASEIPTKIPLFPLSSVILLPKGELPLNIFEPRYLEMFDHALAGDRLIGMIQYAKSGDNAELQYEKIGCVGRITSFQETGDGRYLIALSGISRFEIISIDPIPHPYVWANVNYENFADDLHEHQKIPNLNLDPLFKTLQEYFELQQLDTDWNALRAAPVETLISAMIMVLPLNASEKQALLETKKFEDQVQLFIALAELMVARCSNNTSNSLQ